MDDHESEQLQTLRELLALMREHDLDRVKVKLGEAIYEIVRRIRERSRHSLPQGRAAAPAGPASPAPRRRTASQARTRR